jgi:hypothetical protein
MGFNSTVVVMNDALGDIEKDPEFGKKLSDAILHLSVDRSPQDVSAGCSVNAATVIETHHADQTSLIAVGGNYGTELCGVYNYRHHEEKVQVMILEALADKLGYKIIKKPKKRKPNGQQVPRK